MFRKTPLFITYIAYPLINILASITHQSISRNWIDAFWTFLAFIAIPFITKTKVMNLKNHFPRMNLSRVILANIIIIHYLFPLVFSKFSGTAYLLEVKPLFYLLISLVLVAAFGRPQKEDFVAFGGYLSAIIISDFFIQSLLARQVTRPIGSGEINYDACLLAVSFCCSLSPGNWNKRVVGLIIVGLTFTLSRTAILTVGAITFLFLRTSPRKKLAIGTLFFFLLIASFQERNLDIHNLQSLDRYWMWEAWLQMIASHPFEWLLGFPIGVSVPTNMPDNLTALWTDQEDAYSLNGVYPFNFHAFWIRAGISLGGLIILFIVFKLSSICLNRNFQTFDRSLSLLILLEGMTMGVFYLSNVAIPLILALLLTNWMDLQSPEQEESPAPLGESNRSPATNA